MSNAGVPEPGHRLRPANCAVLALTWQQNMVAPDGFFGAINAAAVSRGGVIQAAASFHARARAAGIPVIFYRLGMPAEAVANSPSVHAMAADPAFAPEGSGTELIQQIGAAPLDQVVQGVRWSAFAGNDLEARLKSAGVDTLAITGVPTHLSVEQTARHASDLGFYVYVISDAVTAADAWTHQASIRNLRLTTMGVIPSDVFLLGMEDAGSSLVQSRASRVVSLVDEEPATATGL